MLIDKINHDGCDSSVSANTSTIYKGISKQACSNSFLMNISAFSLQGMRSHMEDYFDIGYHMKPEAQQRPDEWPFEYFYFGIFDGHGGCDAAKFAKENLLKFITKQPEFWSENDDDILRSIQIGYAATHEAMRKVMHTWPRTHRYLPSTAGTTASVLFIKNGKYYTGHVGDSRIVISKRDSDSKQWISQPMTEDHKPESENEVARIRRAGGDVKSKVGVHRVVWHRPILKQEFEAPYSYVYSSRYNTHTPNYEHEKANEISTYPIHESFVDCYQIIPFLAIARSLGDFWSINPYSGQYIVSPEPDVSCRPIDPNDECILLATDGLWNVVNSQHAIRALEEFKAVRDDERGNGPYAKQYFSTDNFYNVTWPSDRDNYASSLVYLAYQVWGRRSLRSDNITAVVAMLGDILNPQLNISAKRNIKTRSTLNNVQVESFVGLKSLSDHVEANTIQIGKTRKFTELIKLNQTPSFKTVNMVQDEIDTLEKLGNWLMLPPSAVPEVMGIRLIPPQNYIKLHKSDVRRVKNSEISMSSTILIRMVTDDPLDEELGPERSGKKSGVQVRDSSAQCTQSIHDFALSWPGEGYCEKDSDEDYECPDYDEDGNSMEYEDFSDLFDDGEEDEEDDDNFDEDGVDDSPIDEDDEEDADKEDDDDIEDELHSLDKSKDRSVLLFESIELDDWSESKKLVEKSERPTTRRRSRESLNGSNKDHMLQPRSDNCVESPQWRCKTRSKAYLSLTSDPKRKAVNHSSKSKRRRSHPQQCTLAQS